MKRILFQLILVISLTQTLHAQTQVSGYILSNTTWTLANSPYIVTGNILVNNGVTLTIEPGVTVKFDTTKTLQVDGELIAIGNVQNRIVFTASDTTPVRGSWGRIQFSNTSTDAVFDTAGNYVSGSVFKYCDIKYGGGVAGDVTLYCDTAAPYFSNCRISECLKHAIRFTKVVGRIDSSSIRNCGGNAIEVYNPVSAALIVQNDTLEYNGAGIARGGTSTFTSIMIQNCVFTSTGNAIEVKSSANCVIENNIFTSNFTAVGITGSANSIVKNNVFTSNSLGATITSTVSSNIENNEFNANAKACRGNLGVNATITNNRFIGNTQGAIGSDWDYCYAGYVKATNITVANNYLENNKGAIYTSASYCIFQGNTIKNNQFLEEPVCNCSYVYCADTYKLIRLGGGAVLMTNNVLEGNTSPSAGTLVQVDLGGEIANNLFMSNSPGNIVCIGNSNICSNRILNNSGNIISSANSSIGPFIHNNEFLNNTGTGSTISVNNNSIINNNELRGNSSPAILSISGGATISNNRVIGNLNSGSDPIISLANGTANIHHNDFLGNTGLSCMRISTTAIQPVVTQNNFMNSGVQYEIENLISFGPGANINLSNNYWGTINTTHIDSVIKDYFDEANLSVALYPPVLTSPAFVDTNASCTSGVCSLSVSGTTFNPSCYGGANGSITITLANGTSPYSYFWNPGGTTQNRTNLSSGTYTVTVIDANLCSATKSFILTQPTSAVSVVSAVVTDANCNTGGTITISAGGGTSPYTYNWGSGITTQNRTGLNTGNYTITITDSKGCTASQSFVIGQQVGPVISGVVTNISCHNGCDGTIDLSITGIAPFTYDWGTGFGTNEDTSGLCPGNYNVTVADSNNCGIAAAFTVSSPDTLVATAYSISAVSCFGYNDGGATSVVSGGTPPYSFLWNDGQTFLAAYGLSEGTYAVTVTDSLGCTDSASVYMPDGYQVFAGAIGGLSTVGVNQPASYIVSASPDYSYTWNVFNGNILTGQGTNTIEVVWTSAGTGTIQLIAQEQGCADTVTKSVTVTDTTRNCSALFYLYPDTVPHSYFAINTSSGIAQLSYAWNWGDGSAVDTVPYPSHTYSAPGFYTICLTITDSSGCSDSYCNPYFLLKTEGELEMVQVNVYPPSYTAIHNNVFDNISLHPNPTNNIISIQGIPSLQAMESLTLILFDALGKEVWQQTTQPDELSSGVIIDMQTMHEGIYFLRLSTQDGSSSVMKVMKY